MHYGKKYLRFQSLTYSHKENLTSTVRSPFLLLCLILNGGPPIGSTLTTFKYLPLPSIE